MMESAAQLLPWFNLLIVPGLVYIIRLERRILTLELRIEGMLKHCAGCDYWRKPRARELAENGAY